MEEDADGGVAGRFFVKQDHGGPDGMAHRGVIAAALDDAMALALRGAGIEATATRLEVDYRRPVAVGSFVSVHAAVESRDGRSVRLTAVARAGEGGEELAEGRGVFIRVG